jgi:WD40 repeat protein
LIAIGALDGTVALWDRASGKRLAVLGRPRGRKVRTEGPPAGPSVSFSPDGKRLFSGQEAGAGRIWSVPDGRLVTRLDRAGFFATWTPDGRSILTATEREGRALLWNAASGVVRAEFRTGPGFAVMSDDGRLVAVGGAAPGVRVFRVSTGQRVAVVEGASRAFVSFSPDGRRLLTEAADGGVRVFDVAARRTVRIFKPGPQARNATVSRDGTRLLTGHSDGSAYIWDVWTGRRLLDLSGHEGAIITVSFSPDERLALTSSEDSTARLWDAATGRVLAVLAGHGGPVPTAMFTPDGRFVVTASGDVRVWEVSGGAAAVLRGHQDAVYWGEFSPDGRSIISGGPDGTARLWDVATRRQTSLLRPKPPVPGAEFHVGASFSADGRLAITGGAAFPGGPRKIVADAIRVWDLASGRVRTEFFPPQNDPSASALSPDGKRLATGGEGGVLRIWDAAKRTVLETRKVGQTIWGVEWTRDGSTVVALTAGGTIHLFDGTTLRKIRAFGPRQGGALLIPQSPDLSPDESLVAVGHGDRTARVWETATGRLAAELPHAGPVFDTGFSPDGRFLVTASGDAPTIWDLESQRSLVQLFGHTGGVITVDFSPDGSSILSGGEDRSLRIWRCEVCAPIDEVLLLARSRALRELTPAERARFLG